MNVTSTLNDKILTVSLDGRLDTAASAEVNSQINAAIAEAGPLEGIIIDAAKLVFISSSGLRIMLSLRKSCNNLHIANASPDVYNVFEMTGFTKIIDVQKALREVSIEGCEEIGRGGVGIVYKTSADTIVKVFREGSPISDLETEISMAKEAFVLGMPTAISFDIVRVGNQYGLVYEMLDAETLSSAIRKNPERLEEFAVKFAHLVRSLHDIEVVPGGIIPDAHANDEAAINTIRRYFSDEEVDRLLAIHHSIPKGNRLLHCDLHPKNVMLQGDELMLIDMGEVGYGNPILDLSHTYSSMKGLVGDYEAIIGLTEEQSHRFFDRFIREYYSGESEAEVQAHLVDIARGSLVRNFSWLSLSDCFPQEVIDLCHREYKRKFNL